MLQPQIKIRVPFGREKAVVVRVQGDEGVRVVVGVRAQLVEYELHGGLVVVYQVAEVGGVGF